VECCIVEHDDCAAFQTRQKFRRQPFIKNICVARAVKQEWRDQFFAEVAADQTGARASGSRFFPVDFLPDECPSVRAMDCWRKSRFINKDNVSVFIRCFIKML